MPSKQAHNSIMLRNILQLFFANSRLSACWLRPLSSLAGKAAFARVVFSLFSSISGLICCVSRVCGSWTDNNLLTFDYFTRCVRAFFKADVCSYSCHRSFFLCFHLEKKPFSGCLSVSMPFVIIWSSLNRCFPVRVYVEVSFVSCIGCIDNTLSFYMLPVLGRKNY